MDFKQLEYFVHVADLGSFTKASEVLGVAQSALSRHVRQLEVSLGQNLLHRDGRGVSTTEAGKRLLLHGHGILLQVQRARQEVDDMRGAPVGHVNVGFPNSLGRILTVPFVNEFRREFPAAHLSISEGLTLHLHEWLLTGRLEIALLYDPVPSPALDTVLLQQGDYYLFGPLSRPAPATEGECVTLEEMAELPLILPRHPHPLRVMVETKLSHVGRKPRVVLEIDSVAAIAELVAEGLGFGLTSLSAMRLRTSEAKFEFRRIAKPGIQSTLVVATSAERPLTALAQQSVKLIQHMVPAELTGKPVADISKTGFR